MKAFSDLVDHIAGTVQDGLADPDFDSRAFLDGIIPRDASSPLDAICALTPHHALDFRFNDSSLGGSFFLGKCQTRDAVIYGSDLRGDELKPKGSVWQGKGARMTLAQDEGFNVENSVLIHTLVHNMVHDPDSLEDFYIKNTIAAPYANIHGSPISDSVLEPFATVDLTTMHACMVGRYAYVQTGAIRERVIPAGTVWVRADNLFEFSYRYRAEDLAPYIRLDPGYRPAGALMDFAQTQQQPKWSSSHAADSASQVPVPQSSSVCSFAAVRPETHIGDNVLVSQRAYLQEAWMGNGANAQENCSIIGSRLAGCNVTAHGAKIVNTDCGEHIFVGFNSFLHGRAKARIRIGDGCIIMPHTIIDSDRPLQIEDNRLVWGLVRNRAELEANSMPLEALMQVSSEKTHGEMVFKGDGAAFVDAFRGRIHHILEENGAFFDGRNGRGHAQRNKDMAFVSLPAYPEDNRRGIFPTVRIKA